MALDVVSLSVIVELEPYLDLDLDLDDNRLAHNWAVHMHSPNVVPRTDFEGHTTSGVNNL